MSTNGTEVSSWDEVFKLMEADPALKITIRMCIVVKKRQPPGIVFVLNDGKTVDPGNGKPRFERPRGWSLAGGSNMDNETVGQTAVDEAREETNTNISKPTPKDFLYAVLTTDSHIKVYFAARNAKTENLTHKNDKVTSNPVLETKIFAWDEIEDLYIQRALFWQTDKKQGETPKVKDKHGNAYPVYNDELSVAYKIVQRFKYNIEVPVQAA